MAGVKSRLPEFYNKCGRDLDKAMEFWLKHSHDNEHGGFFNCLGRDGKRYDEFKYGWLQGRQIWTYCKLYNEVSRFHKPELLEAAVAAGDFLMSKMKDPQTMKCSFQMTRDGKPVKIQRTIFSECFYALSMCELAKASKNNKYKEEAVAMMDKVIYWVREDDSQLGRPYLAGSRPLNSLAVSMMLVVMIDEVSRDDLALCDKYQDTQDWAIAQTLMHVQRNKSVILENVSLDGNEIPGSQGRIMNPGHAIETGWFLLEHAIRHNKPQLKKTAIEDFMVKPFKTGWDTKHGGIFYFLDADGLSPIQLEWNMKLWWVHNEAMIAFLMAYRETGDEGHLERFAQVFDYCQQHFKDPVYGEWYGYLSRQGEVTHDFKGAPFKGCFHVPRCLYMCEKILQEIISDNSKPTSS